MPSNHLILCCPLLLLPPIPPSIRVFSNESTLPMKWPKYWSFSFRISRSNEHPGLISFRMDWLDLLAVQGTLKSLLQHHSSKASIFRCSAFLIVQLSHPYMITGKTMALTRWIFVGKYPTSNATFLPGFFAPDFPVVNHLKMHCGSADGPCLRSSSATYQLWDPVWASKGGTSRMSPPYRAAVKSRRCCGPQGEGKMPPCTYQLAS